MKRTAAVLILGVLAGGCETLRANRTSVDFGDVFVGRTAGPQTVTWTNTGQQALTVGDVPLTQNPTAFARGAASGFPLTVNPNGTGTFGFTFAPPDPGSFTATALPTLTNPPAGADATQVTLTGRGTAQVAEGDLLIGSNDLDQPIRTNSALDFGSVVVPGGTAVTKRFRLRNLGAGPITVTIAFAQGNQHFSLVQPATPVTIPARGRVRVVAQFAPNAVGTFNDTITFTSGANFAATLLTGQGVPPGGGGD